MRFLDVLIETAVELGSGTGGLGLGVKTESRSLTIESESRGASIGICTGSSRTILVSQDRIVTGAEIPSQNPSINSPSESVGR